MPRTRSRRNYRNVGGHRVKHTAKSVVSGHLYKPPNNIRAVSVRPWNQFTIQWTAIHESDKSITLEDISGRLSLNNGLYFDTINNSVLLEFKVVEAQVYGVTNQTLNVIFFALENLPIGNWEQAHQCLPAKNQYARVGFRWPLSDQSIPFRAGSDEIIRLRGTGTANDSSLLKVRVLWRSYAYSAASIIRMPPPPGDNPELISAMRSLTEAVRGSSISFPNSELGD